MLHLFWLFSHWFASLAHCAQCGIHLAVSGINRCGCNSYFMNSAFDLYSLNRILLTRSLLRSSTTLVAPYSSAPLPLAQQQFCTTLSTWSSSAKPPPHNLVFFFQSRSYPRSDSSGRSLLLFCCCVIRCYFCGSGGGAKKDAARLPTQQWRCCCCCCCSVLFFRVSAKRGRGCRATI